ncbi:MAG: heme lyase NrfEFG subunit NrfE [Legionellales bacterium]|nr:heme lyase NrfEFG subunit NrfE [Legionellales bacterium]|tara:strand:- start:255 stop:2111 length:1857 start_codon:yes stop_codon:yes gene_type:complete
MIVLIGFLTLFFQILMNIRVSLLTLKKKVTISNFNYLVLIQFLLLFISYLSLSYLFLTDQFQVAYVALHSNTYLPLVYKLCAVWGGHEGSFLLWMTLLSLWFCVLWFKTKDCSDLFRVVLARIFSLLLCAFGLFIFFTSNPFLLLLNPPTNGADLNPLLQDPGMVSHPPILYMGYVGFAAVYACTIAGIISRETQWLELTRKSALIAWSFMSIGITLGSHWAYRELGWGGWWFWDPVENASFMPWLIGTALIHSLMIAKSNKHFIPWVALLSIFGFSLSILGTFLVRSGVLISVHAFATDPARGVYLLSLFVFSLLISITLLVVSLNKNKLIDEWKFDWSITSLLIANNLLFIVAMFVVLLGTLFPMIYMVLVSKNLSVGPPYFNQVLLPIFILLMMLMGLSIQFTRHRSREVIFRDLVQLILAVFMSTSFLLLWGGQLKIVAIISLAWPFWLLIIHFDYLKNNQYFKWSALIAHLGLIVTTIGIIMSTLYSDERLISMKLGEQEQIGNNTLIWQHATKINESNYNGFKAWFLIKKGDLLIARLNPEYRIYTTSQSPLPHAGIASQWWGDYHLNIGQHLNEGSWMIRWQMKPFIRFIWYGVIMMAIGGFIGLRREYAK